MTKLVLILSLIAVILVSSTLGARPRSRSRSPSPTPFKTITTPHKKGSGKVKITDFNLRNPSGSGFAKTIKADRKAGKQTIGEWERGKAPGWQQGQGKSGRKIPEEAGTMAEGKKSGVRLDMQGTFPKPVGKKDKKYGNFQLQQNKPRVNGAPTTIAQVNMPHKLAIQRPGYLTKGLFKSLETGKVVEIDQRKEARPSISKGGRGRSRS